MKIKEIIAKTNRYINGQSNLPILVDLPNADMLIEYRLHYNVGHHEIIEAGHYCGHDNLPMMDKLKNDLGNKKDTMFLFGLEPFLQLQGRDVVISEIKSLMQLSCAGKLIIVTLACSDLLKAFDKRYFRADFSAWYMGHEV